MAIIDSMFLIHDIDAFSDIKIVALCDEFGIEAYALYWVILEQMFPEDTLSLPYSEMTFRALKARTKPQNDIKQVVDRAIEYGLFETDGALFWSPSLERRMERLDKNAKEKSERARKAANARWANRESSKEEKKEEENTLDKCISDANAIHDDASALQMQCRSNADALQSDANKIIKDKTRKDDTISAQSPIDKNGDVATGKAKTRSPTDSVDVMAIASQAHSIAMASEEQRLGNVDTSKILNNDRFEEFWRVYDKKVSKTTAKKAWDKIKMTDALFEEIMIAIRNQLKYDQWSSKQYQPHASTWLNQKRWEDEIVPSKEQTKNQGNTWGASAMNQYRREQKKIGEKNESTTEPYDVQFARILAEEEKQRQRVAESQRRLREREDNAGA